MKKNWLLYLLLIILVVGAIALLIYFIPNKSVSSVSYDKLKEAANRSYEVNISYSNIDSFNVFGAYDSQNSVLKYETDEMEEETKSININLYNTLLEYLPQKDYSKDSQEEVLIPANELFKKIRFLNIRNEASRMKCNYEVLDNVIYAISCVDAGGGAEALNIDFMFD